jgi:hypothetical protein
MSLHRCEFLAMLLLFVVAGALAVDVPADEPSAKTKDASDELVRTESKEATDRAAQEIGQWKFD